MPDRVEELRHYLPGKWNGQSGHEAERLLMNVARDRSVGAARMAGEAFIALSTLAKRDNEVGVWFV